MDGENRGLDLETYASKVFDEPGATISHAYWTSSEKNWLGAMMRFADAERGKPLTVYNISDAAVERLADEIARAVDPDRDHSGKVIPDGIKE